MKQKVRKRLLDELLAELSLADFDKREFALFQFALILDRSNRTDPDIHFPDYYFENLPRDLLRLRLSAPEQEVVAAQLGRLIRSKSESRATAIWTLGKVKGDISFHLLLALVISLGEHLDSQAAYQLCSALRNWLESGVVFDRRDQQAELCHILQNLKVWHSSSDDRLRTSSGLVIHHLERRTDNALDSTA